MRKLIGKIPTNDPTAFHYVFRVPSGIAPDCREPGCGRIRDEEMIEVITYRIIDSETKQAIGPHRHFCLYHGQEWVTKACMYQ